MDATIIEARARKIFGKRCRYLRRAGITPANIYGAGMQSIAVQVDSKTLARIVTGIPRNTPVQLAILGESSPRTAFIWGVQHDPMTDDIVHVDFYHVEASHQMKASVPLVLDNVDPDLGKFDKRVNQITDAVDVETLPGDLPTEIIVDCSRLQEVDDEIMVGDLRMPPGVTLLTDPGLVVAKVGAIAELVEEEPEVEEEAEAPAEEAEEPPEAGQEEGEEPKEE